MKTLPIKITYHTNEELNVVEIQGRIKNEIVIVKESQNTGEDWIDDYKEGFIDGLQRSLELFSFKN